MDDDDFHGLAKPAFVKLVLTILAERSINHQFRPPEGSDVVAPIDETFRVLTFIDPTAKERLLGIGGYRWEIDIAPSDNPTLLLERWVIEWVPGPTPGVVGTRINPAFWSLCRATTSMLRYLPCYSSHFRPRLFNENLPHLTVNLFYSDEHLNDPSRTTFRRTFLQSNFQPVQSWTGALRVSIFWDPHPPIGSEAAEAVALPVSVPTPASTSAPIPVPAETAAPTPALSAPPPPATTTPPPPSAPEPVLFPPPTSHPLEPAEIDRLFRPLSAQRRTQVRQVKLTEQQTRHPLLREPFTPFNHAERQSLLPSRANGQHSLDHIFSQLSLNDFVPAILPTPTESLQIVDRCAAALKSCS